MAVKSKADIEADIDALFVNNSSGTIEADDVNTLIKDITDSYENYIQSYTTAQRDLIVSPPPVERTIIYNTDNDRYEFHDGTSWKGFTGVKTFALDCSAEPNYPAAQKGDEWTVSVAGKIGGSGGEIVSVGAIIKCIVTTAGGDSVTAAADFIITHSSNQYGDNIGVNTILQTTAAKDLDPISNYATPLNVIATEVIDLTQTGIYNYSFATGTKFVVESIRAIITDIDYNSTDTDALFDIGTALSGVEFAEDASIAGTVNGAVKTIFRDNDVNGITDIEINIHTASTQATHKARFLITGISIQDEA